MINIEEKFDEQNQISIRKLYCDVYTNAMKDCSDNNFAKEKAVKAVIDYLSIFKPEMKKAPEGAKE
ncbi:MAG: hypothetical protein AAGJ72_22020 [Pseudomonadota bacterium]